jgi:hypothetical protein
MHTLMIRLYFCLSKTYPAIRHLQPFFPNSKIGLRIDVEFGGAIMENRRIVGEDERPMMGFNMQVRRLRHGIS